MRFRDHIKSPLEWRQYARKHYPRITTWRRAAQRFAAEQGDAIAYLCDDSVVYFTRDHDGKVRQEKRQRELGHLLKRERLLSPADQP